MLKDIQLVLNLILSISAIISLYKYSVQKEKDIQKEYQRKYLVLRKKQKFIKFYDNEFLPMLIESEK